MNYAEQQRQPSKHAFGFVVVVILHIALGYALVNGLARKVVEVIKAPLETKIIEEVKKPPPPELPPPPPPKMVQVMPTFVPPPEVQIQQPVIQQPVIANVTAVAPPVYAPPAPPAPPAPVVAAVPTVGVACPNSQEIRKDIKYPIKARREGIQGEVLIEFTVTANGGVSSVDVKSSSNPIFNSVSISAVRQFRCTPQPRDIRVQVPFVFSLTDE